MTSDNETIVTKCYLELLCRKPDNDGLNYYLTLLNSNSIDENGLREQIKNSSEYKILQQTLEFEKTSTIKFQKNFFILI